MKQNHSKKINLMGLSKRELELERVYLGLRTFKELDINEVLSRESDKALDSLVKKWDLVGYLRSIEEGIVKLSPKGFLLLDSIMDDIFRENII